MKLSNNNKIYFKPFLYLLLILLSVKSNAITTIVPSLCRVFNGNINTTRTGINSPYSFTIRTAGDYIVECQSVTPSSFTSFQGNVNNTVQNTATNVNYFFAKDFVVQLGYSLQVLKPLTMPPMCSKFVIKYRIKNISNQIVLDWVEIEIIRNDYFNKNAEEVDYVNTPDLFLQDQPNDLGYQPYIENLQEKDYTRLTNSQDIWNRHDNSVSDQNLNPMHSIQTPANTNFLNYTIRNRSCATTPASNLKLYWTIARMNEFWAHDWRNFNRGTFYSDNKVTYLGADYPLGNEISIADPFDYSSSEASIAIPSISAAGTYTLRAPWLVPNPNWAKNGSYKGRFPIQFNSSTSNPVICLLARLDEPWRTDYINGYVSNPNETSSNYDNNIIYHANWNNNVVTKNLYVLNSVDGYVWKPINGNPRSRGGEIIVNPINGNNPPPLNIGVIRDTSAYDSLTTIPVFTNYGHVNLYLDSLIWVRWVEGGMIGENIEVVSAQIIRITNSNFAKLNNIQLNEGEISKIAIETEYFEANTPENDFEYNFAVGSLNDSTNTLIGSPSNFIANVLDTPNLESANGEQYFTTGLNNKKFDNNVFSIYPNPSKSDVYVNFKALKNSTYSVKVLDLSGKIILNINKDLKEGNNIFKLDLEILNEGIYFISISNSEINLTQKIIISK